jgi:hypothetical protein
MLLPGLQIDLLTHKYCAAKHHWFSQPSVRAAPGIIRAASFYRYFALMEQSKSN